MKKSKELTRSIKAYTPHAALCMGALVVAGMIAWAPWAKVSYTGGQGAFAATSSVRLHPPLNVEEYNVRLLALGRVATTSPWHVAFLMGTTSASTTLPKPLWPSFGKAYPRDGRALLPFNRIVAYYGNFYSTQMGVLGEYPEEVVLEKLRDAVAQWEEADETTPVVPAIEYIDVTAQGSAGKDGKYRLRMPDSQIDKALAMAKKIKGIVVLDLQVGLSSVEEELPLLEKYMAMPEVHLAIDPEFDMPGATPPGRVIGTTDASTFNWAAQYLAKLVREHDLPPKILLIHRFTEGMVTNYKDIEPLPEVQMVVQMDGWGSPQRKKNTYDTVIYPEPIQFAGLKLFYKNDLKEDPSRLLTTKEILELTPIPIYIQYQ